MTSEAVTAVPAPEHEQSPSGQRTSSVAPRSVVLAVLVSAAIGAVFIWDAETPHGYSPWVLYFPLCIACLWLEGKWPARIAAIACSALIVLGFVISPPGGIVAAAVLDRTLGIVILLSGVVFGEKYLRRQAEIARYGGALRRSEERFRGLFETMSEGFFLAELVFDAAGKPVDWRYLDVNPAHERIIGQRREALIGRTVRELFPGIEDYWLDAQFRTALTGEPTQVRGFNKDTGRQFTLHLYSPRRGQFACIFSDVTEREAAERLARENEIRAAEAEAANRAKSEFLARMSHELRTPMNAMLGFAQLLELDAREPLTERQKNSVANILHGGRHLTELINEVLDLAAIESGRVALSIEPVSVGTVARRCVTLVQTMATARSIEVRLSSGADFKVLADDTRLKQVLLNLLSNAIKYNRDGGRVEVSCTEARDDMLRIAVTDTGMGIAPSRRAELFQPFNRLGAENTAVEGTGIGLTITRRLVDAMNGRMGCDSDYGRGSTFWVELPRAESGASKESAAAVAEIPGRPVVSELRGRVLYIEDDAANVRSMEAMLRRLTGIELQTAPTAEIGLAAARRMRPDIILMDINLPGMDGVEALQRLRADPAVPRVPVIAVSARAARWDIERGLTAGFDAYLTKPIDARQMLDLIATALQPKAG